MLPDLEALLAGYTLYAKQNRFAPERDESRLAEALGEAGALARGHEEDEPAALLFALTRRPRVFGKAHGRMTLHLTVEQAHALGLAFTADVAVLELMRARVLREEIGFEELRGWFAARLTRVARKPWPPP
jgi:N-acyl-D-aspartate/D-glutamate deacylase